MYLKYTGYVVKAFASVAKVTTMLNNKPIESITKDATNLKSEIMQILTINVM